MYLYLYFQSILTLKLFFLIRSRKSYLEETGSSLSHDGTLKSSKGSRGQLARRSGGIFSNPFKTDREKMDQLTELLNLYSVHGIPEQPGLLGFTPDQEKWETGRYKLMYPNSSTSSTTSSVSTGSTLNLNSSNSSISSKQLSDESLFLEDHWRCIVTNWETMPKKLQNQQDAIWELLHTEVFYIKRLRVISDLFLSCLCNLQGECLLNDIDTEKMFSNIVDVYKANLYFWLNHLLPMLKQSRETHQPLNPLIMKDGFLNFDIIFRPYVRYCLEHSNCLHYVKEKHKESELFKAYVVVSFLKQEKKIFQSFFFTNIFLDIFKTFLFFHHHNSFSTFSGVKLVKIVTDYG